MRNDYYLATSDHKGTVRLFDCVDLNQAKAKATKHAKKHSKRGADIMLFDENKNLLVTKKNLTNSKWSGNGNEPIVDYHLEQDVIACEKAILSLEPLILEPEEMEVKTDLEVKILTSKPEAEQPKAKIGRPKKEATQVMRVPVAIAHHLEQIIRDYKAGNWTPPKPEHWLESFKGSDDDGLIDLLKRD